MNKTGRLSSIDAFRGLTIALMIIVNNQGDWSHVYPVLRHASWNGWRGADIVFPFFLFVTGVSIALAFTPRLECGERKGPLVYKIIKRSVILIVLGLIINLLPKFDFSTMRIPGVLQRIGICYFLAACIFLFFRRRARWVMTLLLLAGYGFILKFLTPDGFGQGDLSPHGNICRAVDTFFLGGHTYSHSPARGFDPEGILSTLGALASTLTGSIAGERLIKTVIPDVPEPADETYDSSRLKFSIILNRVIKKLKFDTTALFVLSGFMLVFSGLFLDQWIPINKNLWTPSYVLFMAGLSFLILALFHRIIDIKKIKGWSILLIILGINSITAYVLSSAAGKILATVNVTISERSHAPIKSIIVETVFKPLLSPAGASLCYAITLLVLCWLAMCLLYRRRIIIKI